MTDSVRLKRLRYRSWHRGCKETDLVLGRFADEKLATLAPELLPAYEKLLDENDGDIWNWLIGKDTPSHTGYLALIPLLKAYTPA